MKNEAQVTLEIFLILLARHSDGNVFGDDKILSVANSLAKKLISKHGEPDDHTDNVRFLDTSR